MEILAGSNQDIFLNISMFVKTNFTPIIQGAFQVAQELYKLGSAENSERSEKSENVEESEEVIIETDEEEYLEKSEENIEENLEEEDVESEPNVEESETNVEESEEEAEEKSKTNVEESEESEEEAEEKSEPNVEESEASEEAEEEFFEENVEEMKNSPTPRKRSPKKVKDEKPKNDFVKENDFIFKNMHLQISLPQTKPKSNKTQKKTKTGSIAIKPYKPTDVLIRSLKEIDYKQLENGEYSIADLKHFATLLNISTTEKIEDLQQQILDLMEQYVV